jgi:multicomponent Na+:H+ antiporter subunit F
MTILNMLSFGLLIAAFVLAFARMIRDPRREHRILALDRVVAVDLMSTLSIGLMILYAAVTGQTVFFDVAITLAFIAFLGTIAFARYVEKGKK